MVLLAGRAGSDGAGPPRRVFEALTRDITAWWGPPHIVDEERGRDIVLEPRLGGRLYEDWGDSAGALWATVTRVRPDEYLELTGPLGTRRLVLGLITFTLEPRGGAPRSCGSPTARSGRWSRRRRPPKMRGGGIC